LSTPISKGKTVNISYSKGSLSSKIGVPVPAFSSAVTNNSTITAVTEIGNPEATIYPNPFTNQLYIENAEQFEVVTICDLVGKILIEDKLTRNETNVVNTECLKKGMYILKVSNGQAIKVFKIVKQNVKP